jgi:hypothetical protein
MKTVDDYPPYNIVKTGADAYCWAAKAFVMVARGRICSILS